VRSDVTGVGSDSSTVVFREFLHLDHVRRVPTRIRSRIGKRHLANGPDVSELPLGVFESYMSYPLSLNRSYFCFTQLDSVVCLLLDGCASVAGGWPSVFVPLLAFFVVVDDADRDL